MNTTKFVSRRKIVSSSRRPP